MVADIIALGAFLVAFGISGPIAAISLAANIDTTAAATLTAHGERVRDRAYGRDASGWSTVDLPGPVSGRQAPPVEPLLYPFWKSMFVSYNHHAPDNSEWLPRSSNTSGLLAAIEFSKASRIDTTTEP